MQKQNGGNKGNNPFYPLPADYPDLTEAGRKEARLSILQDQSTPQKLVRAWVLFRTLYLRPREDAFYKRGFHPSPLFHYQMIYDLGRYARNALAAPRGFAKSVCMGTEVPLLLALSRPYYVISLCLATDRMVEERFDVLMAELTENEYIVNDFGVLKPKRREATWNHHLLHLRNGSIVQGLSVMARKRGTRPQLFIMDDPEFDPAAGGMGTIASQYILTEKYEYILFRQIIPMLEKGSAIFWIGTMLNRRCLLYRACAGDDKRFKNWMRRVYAAENGPNDVLWPEHWPYKFLQARRAEIGVSAYDAEYRNIPVSKEDRILQIDPVLNEYDIPQYSQYSQYPQEAEWDSSKGKQTKMLLASELDVVWNERQWVAEKEEYETVKKKEQARSLFPRMFRIALVDTASGLRTRNDFRCIGVLGYDPTGALWVLDMWMGKVRDSTFISKIYEMAMLWRVRFIGIEACGTQQALVDTMDEFLEKLKDRYSQDLTGGLGPLQMPRIMPIRYPSGVSKSGRIAGLEWRFPSGKIKYPRHRATEWPFSALYEQTENFTIDLALLEHDDAIDTVAMSHYAVHQKGQKLQNVPIRETLVQRIKENKPLAPGLPVLSGVPLSRIGQEELNVLVEKAYQEQTRPGNRTRPRPNVVG